jgi:hypothetical protein
LYHVDNKTNPHRGPLRSICVWSHGFSSNDLTGCKYYFLAVDERMK